MRKNAPRKWLHAILDLLPVVLIPVFMIFSHRHNPVNDSELEVTYKYQSNEVNSLDDLQVGKIYSIDNFYLGYDYIYFSYANDTEVSLYFIQGNFSSLNDYTFTWSEGLYENQIDWRSENSLQMYYSFSDDTLGNITSDLDLYLWVDYYYTSLVNDDSISSLHFTNCIVYFKNQSKLNSFKNYYTHFNNSDNEGGVQISLPQYTDYNEIVSAELVGGDSDTITDVFVNNFNSTISQYFNMGEIFNLTGFYNWFNTNLFNGNAPQIIYSVWNIIVYEFVLDLLFFIYHVLMFLIDWIGSLMDKMLNKSSGGNL